MYTHLRAGFAIAVLLVAGAALAAEPGDPEAAGGITVEEALAEPADPDDAADIRADNDPNDVGQRALDPESEASVSGGPPSGGGDLPDRGSPPAPAQEIP